MLASFLLLFAISNIDDLSEPPDDPPESESEVERQSHFSEHSLLSERESNNYLGTQNDSTIQEEEGDYMHNYKMHYDEKEEKHHRGPVPLPRKSVALPRGVFASQAASTEPGTGTGTGNSGSVPRPALRVSTARLSTGHRPPPAPVCVFAPRRPLSARRA